MSAEDQIRARWLRHHGDKHLKEGRWHEALEALREAKSLFLTSGSPDQVAECDIGAGRALRELGCHREVLNTLQARHANLELDDQGRVAECHPNAATRIVRPGEVLAVLFLTREAYAEQEEFCSVADCDYGIGRVLHELRCHEEALNAFRRARQVYEEGLDDKGRVAKCDIGAANALGNLGRYEEALAAFSLARKLFEGLEHRGWVADCDLGTGSALSEVGRHHAALDAFSLAREAYEELGEQLWVAACDIATGTVLVDALGRHAEGLCAFHSAREIFEDLREEGGVANSNHNTGVALHRLGRYQEALHAFALAQKAYGDHEDRHRIGSCKFGAGEALFELGRGKEAVEALRMALPVLKEFGRWNLANRAQERMDATLLAQAERRLVACRDAQEAYARAGRWVESAGAKVETAQALIALGQPEESVVLLASARATYDKIGLAFEAATCAEKLGLAYDALGQWPEAAASYRSAAAAYQALEADPVLQIGAWGAAKVAHQVANQPLEAATAGRTLAETLAGANRVWEALDTYQQAARNFDDQGQPLEAARCRKGAADALARLDRHQEALKLVAQAEWTLARSHQVLEVAQCKAIRGGICAALGHYSKAQRVLLSARSSLDKAGQSEEVADCDLALAWVHLSQGQPQLAFNCAEAAKEAFDHKSAVAACELVRARALVLLAAKKDLEDEVARHWTAEAFNAAHQARASFLAAHFGLRAALADEVLVEAHLSLAQLASTEAEATRQRRAALDGALRAVGVIDAHRYELEDPGLRSSWTDQAHAAAYARAFSLAHDHAQKPRLAQLVESARVQGLPARRQVSDMWTAMGPKAAARPAQITPALTSMDEEASAKTEALAQAGERVPLAPAAVVVAGTPPLAEEAKRRVALDQVLVQAGGEGAWWWGSWVAGDSLYWSFLGPEDTGVVEAGAIPMADLEPLMARLNQALPQRLEGETTEQALERALGGAMAHYSSEAALAAELGSVLLPVPLRECLDDLSEKSPLSLVVAPAPELGRLPFALLGLDDTDKPLRLGERAVVRLGASAALLGAVSSRERTRSGGAPGPDSRMLSVVDPGGLGLFGDGGVPGAWGQAVLSRPQNLEALVGKGFASELATKQALADHLRQGLDVMAFLGHAHPGRQFSVDAHLELWDKVVSAREWLYEPESWTLPARVGLLACGSGGAEAPEWLGLAPAALSAGARVVMATAWNLPNDKPVDTWVLADQVVRVLRDGEDPGASWRRAFLGHLRCWQRGQDKALSPLLWGAVQVVGLEN
ncbi:MAG TPA: tetratricopeptide repeat protein [Acidimicrobiales bacterium]|nr:tetratricopeptide repeat protein [Acidimicrobiales bacterium]